MESKGFISSEKLKPHPQQNWNFIETVFGNILFCWTLPIFAKGLKKDISEEDLYQTLKEHEANRLTDKLEKALRNQKHTSKPSLWIALWKVFKWDIILSIILYFFLEFIISIARPLALGKLMGYYDPEQTTVSKSDIIIYASVIIIASFISAIMEQVFMIQFQQIALKARVACSSLIYRKALKLSKTTLNETTVGHIINLLSNDMQRLVTFWTSFNAIWSTPLQTILILYLLYAVAGPTALVGIIFLAILIPIQLYLSKKSSTYRLKIALKTDERIRFMSEIISGIQVIKVYTWENSFIKLIDTIRRKEIKLIKIANYIEAITIAFSFFIDRTAIFLCILTYVLTGNAPNAQYVFVVSSFYDILMVSISLYFPQAVSETLQARVAVQRFESFLNLEEIQRQVKISDKVGIKIEKATAKWCKESPQNTLTDINFQLHYNEMIAIVGPIGSGKSSLLQLCLGEIPLIKGHIEVGGTISYASQEPWLFAGSIKQNILFGQPMIPKKYNEVIRACALEEDLNQFPFGDNTIVGERGILLSGGQKARINLARAVYKQADIYLLDDPLSAVDASVGRQIFHYCIRGYLKDKCTVLVTHQIQHLTSVDNIYLVTNGSIAVSGSYQDLLASGKDFTKILNYVIHNDDTNEPSAVESTSEILDQGEEDEEKEGRKSGKVSRKVYSTYIRSTGTYGNSFAIVVLFILTEALATGTDYFLTFWVNLEQESMSTNITSNGGTIQSVYQFFTRENCIYIYTVVISALIICSISRSTSFVKSCMRASVSLHNKMFSNIVNATMRFFYTNSSGRILNRFAKDIGNTDEQLPEILMDTVQLVFAVLGTTLAICLVSPWTIFPSLGIFLIMYGLKAIFMASSRSLKRLEATNRSPIFAHLTESMKGLTTIRASNAGQTLEREFDNYQNVYSSTYYMYICCRRAFATWLDTVCVVYVLIVTTISLMTEKYGGNVGFVITQSMSLTGMFRWAVRQWSELENQMTSVERIIEYTKIEQESNIDTKEPSPLWPDQGKIEFNSVFMQYAPNTPYVLKHLNLLIKPKEKIGIVGRTGAGKSSLISVLFRLINFDGQIFIDEVNTKEIPLFSLRSKISIIPQDPVLFSGTVRKNLDPFDEYQDDQMWKVLKEVKLEDFVSSLPSGLYSNLAEGGSNFSVGQKQLICLARALLRNNKILMLDEATANVDPQTDELLQKTIRENFANCTVLTIAHRLHTVMDSDKVLVMDDGVAVEFDHPFRLLQKKGAFHDLVVKTGKYMGENLLEIAQKTYLETSQKIT